MTSNCPWVTTMIEIHHWWPVKTVAFCWLPPQWFARIYWIILDLFLVGFSGLIEICVQRSPNLPKPLPRRVTTAFWHLWLQLLRSRGWCGKCRNWEKRSSNLASNRSIPKVSSERRRAYLQQFSSEAMLVSIRDCHTLRLPSGKLI